MNNGVTFERISSAMAEPLLLWLYRSRYQNSNSRERADWDKNARDICRNWCMDVLTIAYQLDIPINADNSKLDPYTISELFELDSELAQKSEKLGASFARRFIDFFSDEPWMPEESVVMTYSEMKKSPLPECAWSRLFAFPALRGRDRKLFLVRLHEGDSPYDESIGLDIDDCPDFFFPADHETATKYHYPEWNKEIQKILDAKGLPSGKARKLNGISSRISKSKKIISDCLGHKNSLDALLVSDGLASGLNEIQVSIFMGLEPDACKKFVKIPSKRNKPDEKALKIFETIDFVCRTMLVMTDASSAMHGKDMLVICDSIKHYIDTLSKKCEKFYSIKK